MKKFIKINSKDNVLVALADLEEGEVLAVDVPPTVDAPQTASEPEKAAGLHIQLKEAVKRGHKIALEDMKPGDNIIKYGFPIGHATKHIFRGEFVHVHNMKTNLEGISEYAYNKSIKQHVYENRNLTFQGYRREDGSVGVRNELWIVPTVGCVNGMADRIIERFKKEVNPEGIDAIVVQKHNYGCSQLGGDHANTRTILVDVAKHPNAGGVLVFGLGCENNTMSGFKEALGSYNKQRMRFLVAQEVSDEIEEGAKLLKEIYENMKKDKREEISLSELKIGLKCGASDGLSGITANPLVGEFSDFLVSQGGTAVLTEVPEMFGAETILMERAENEEIFDKTVHLINDFKEYFMKFDQPVYENPSPGNKAGGISTLEEKSLGCTQKSGTSAVKDVLKYGETLKVKGLNLLSAPGNDLVAASAEAAAGCQIVLFTTGRGTPFGSFVPTMKISTNSSIYNLKPHWIDFNAGVLIEDISMGEVLENFIDYIIKVASGEMVNNEKNGFIELAIFKSGVTL